MLNPLPGITSGTDGDSEVASIAMSVSSYYVIVSVCLILLISLFVFVAICLRCCMFSFVYWLLVARNIYW
jgi:uncharacterized integral membrane protein